MIRRTTGLLLLQSSVGFISPFKMTSSAIFYRLVRPLGTTLQPEPWSSVENTPPSPIPTLSAPQPMNSVGTAGAATKKLYIENTYLFRVDGARVIDFSEADGNVKIKLDKTIFHPQGGGQPSDVGVIRSADGVHAVQVNMVKEDRTTGIVEHTGTVVSGSAVGLSEAEVVLEIDEAKRRLYARLHSAGHALDVAMEALGYKLKPTKGYHFPDGPYVEYEGAMSAEEKETLPVRLTAAIKALSAPSEVRYVSKEAVGELCQGSDLSLFPDDALIRVVNIAGGWCVCGGTHVGSVEEIGEVVVTKTKSKKNILQVKYELAG